MFGNHLVGMYRMSKWRLLWIAFVPFTNQYSTLNQITPNELTRISIWSRDNNLLGRACGEKWFEMREEQLLVVRTVHMRLASINHPKSRKNLGFDGIKYMIYVHIYKIFLQDRLMIETRSLSKFPHYFLHNCNIYMNQFWHVRRRTYLTPSKQIMYLVRTSIFR